MCPVDHLQPEQERNPWLRLDRLPDSPFKCLICYKSHPKFHSSRLSAGGFSRFPPSKAALKSISERESDRLHKSDLKVVHYFLQLLWKQDSYLQVWSLHSSSLSQISWFLFFFTALVSLCCLPSLQTPYVSGLRCPTTRSQTSSPVKLKVKRYLG